MKIVCLGDIHGRNWWRTIIDKEDDADLYIFLGDYVSTHDNIIYSQQISVFNDILTFKEENPDKVILLTGNHDLQHLGYSWAKCSSFDYEVYCWMTSEKTKRRILNALQMIYVDDKNKIIFSHAGISTIWMKNTGITDIHDINKLQHCPVFAFNPDNYYDYSGNSVTQPPVWIRPKSLYKCMLKGYTQVVGHTPMYKIVNIKELLSKTEQTQYNVENLWCIDTELQQYLVIQDNDFIIKTV